MPTTNFLTSAYGFAPPFTPYRRAPMFTPYAAEIVKHYGNSMPWYFTTEAALDPEAGITRLTQIMRPQNHDVLILGASATIVMGAMTGYQRVFLNITHLETGIPWAVPGKIDFLSSWRHRGTCNRRQQS